MTCKKRYGNAPILNVQNVYALDLTNIYFERIDSIGVFNSDLSILFEGSHNNNFTFLREPLAYNRRRNEKNDEQERNPSV